MSTKSTIASGKGFHFYSEMFDEDNVYLHFDPDAEVQFMATPQSLTVAIPIAVLETIRRTKPQDFSLLETSDEVLLERATKEIDEQRREADEWRANNPDWESRATAPFLAPDTVPREDRISWLFADYKKERERQQRILARMKTYEISNGATFAIDVSSGKSEVIIGTVADGTGEQTEPPR